MTKRNWILAGVVAGVVALLCCTAVAVAGVAYFNRESPEKVVNEYLTALQQRDRPRAADLMCDGMQTGIAGKLLGLAQNWSEIVDWEITDVKSGGEKSAEVFTRITYKIAGVSASVGSFKFTVIDEDEGWRICGFTSSDIRIDG